MKGLNILPLLKVTVLNCGHSNYLCDWNVLSNDKIPFEWNVSGLWKLRIWLKLLEQCEVFDKVKYNLYMWNINHYVLKNCKC